MKAVMAAIVCAGAVLAWHGPAGADPWKNESGKHWRGGGAYERGEAQRRYSHYARIPYGHRPPRGECRVWYRGRPAGHQPPPYRC
jgi:hypothetical protein